ncbi:MAG: nuclear transport factor 2 family protein [Mongoliitalea sp.]
MEPLSPAKLVESYIEYYNEMNVWGMLSCLHDDIVFENYSKGVLMLRLEGIQAFEIQAEKACTFFNWRKQTILNWQISENEIVITIDYHAQLAMDFSSRMKAGDELKLTGTSTFHFKDGLISSIKDES